MRRSPGPPKYGTVSSKGQFAVPQRMRAYYGLRPGDKVVLWTDGRSMLVQPVLTLPPHPRTSYEQAAATLRAFRRVYGKAFAPSLLPPDVLDAARHYHLLG